jgi:hypothetical protein
MAAAAEPAPTSTRTSIPTAAPASPPALTEDVTAAASTGEVPAELQAAEASFWRYAVIGVLIGMPVCAVIWVGIVALAMVVTGTDLDWGVAMIMAVIVGCFAGIFFGGWAGVTISAEKLEEAERASHQHA